MQINSFEFFQTSSHKRLTHKQPKKVPKLKDYNQEVNNGKCSTVVVGSSEINNSLFRDCCELGFNQSLRFKYKQKNDDGNTHKLQPKSKQILINWIKENFLTILAKKPVFFEDHHQIKITHLFDETTLNNQLQQLIHSEKEDDLNTIKNFIDNIFKSSHVLKFKPVLLLLQKKILECNHFQLKLLFLINCTNIANSMNATKTPADYKDLFDSNQMAGKKIEIYLPNGHITTGKIFSVKQDEIKVNNDNGTYETYSNYMYGMDFNILIESDSVDYEYSFGKLKTPADMELIKTLAKNEFKKKRIRYDLSNRYIYSGTFKKLVGPYFYLELDEEERQGQWNVYSKDKALNFVNNAFKVYRTVSEKREWLNNSVQEFKKKLLIECFRNQDLHTRLQFFQELPLIKRHQFLHEATPVISDTAFSGDGREVFIDHLKEVSKYSFLRRDLEKCVSILNKISDLENKKQFFEKLPLQLKVHIFWEHAQNEDFIINVLNLENYEKYSEILNKGIEKHTPQILVMLKNHLLNKDNQQTLIKYLNNSRSPGDYQLAHGLLKKILNDRDCEALKAYPIHWLATFVSKIDDEELTYLGTELSANMYIKLIQELDNVNSEQIPSLLDLIKKDQPTLLKSLLDSQWVKSRVYSPWIKKLMTMSLEDPNFLNLFSEECISNFVIDYLSEEKLCRNPEKNNTIILVIQRIINDEILNKIIDKLCPDRDKTLKDNLKLLLLKENLNYSEPRCEPIPHAISVP